MEKKTKRQEIDFIPEEIEWQPDENPEVWVNEEDEDLERTMVLKPLVDHVEMPDGYTDDYPNEEERKPSYLKYGKDPYDNLEKKPEVYPEDRNIWSGRQSAGKRKGSRGERRNTEQMKSERRGEKKKEGRIWWQRPILLRLVSLMLMMTLLVGLGKGLWAEKEVFGSLTSILEEKNYEAFLYLLLAAGTIVYGVFSLLWLLSRRRVYWDGRLKRMDVGRGITSFLFFAFLAFAGARLALRLPGDSWFFGGISRYFLAVASVQSLIYICSGLGIVSCILRKMIK